MTHPSGHTEARRPASRLARSILALAPPVVAFVVQLALRESLEPLVWFLFFPAVFLSSWIGGLRRGILATVICTAAVLWFFSPPVHSFEASPAHYVAAVVFFATGVLFAVFHERLRSASRRTAEALAASEQANERQRELEEALRRQHDDLERAQTVAKVGSWRLDVRRNVLVWTPESYRIFGVPPGTPMTYEAFLSCVHPEDRAKVDRAWTAALRGAPYDIQHRVVADGAVKWVREKAELEFDRDGALVGGIGITHDVTEREEREQALRDARERAELAIRGADLGTWDWNVQTGAVAFNARWAEMRGYRPDEIRGHVDTWIDGMHPDDRERVKATLDGYLAGRCAEYEAEHRVRTKSGEYVWILDRGKLVSRDASGRPLRMAGTELDITAHKRAEEEIRLAEAKASGILSISADAIVAIDGEQRITLFNAGAEKTFGYARSEALGQPLEMLFPERYREAHRRHVAQFARGPEVARRMGELVPGVFGRRKNGEEFPADAAISKLDVGGSTILTVSLRDVTEQKRTEREQRLLAEIGAVLAATLDYEETVTNLARLIARELADFCIVDVIQDGDVAHQRVVSRDPERDWLGDALSEIELDRRRTYLTREAIDTQKAVLIERVTPEVLAAIAQNERHLRALQGLDPKSVVVVPLVARGVALGALGLVSSSESRRYGPADVRLGEEVALRAALAIENARLYRLATRAVHARDDVLGIVAHDLRSPLGAIKLQAGLIRRVGGEPTRTRAAVDGIERAADRMNRLIDDLLDVTRIEAGHFPLDRAPLSTARVVADAMDAHRAIAASASVELRADVAPGVPDVCGDRERLAQVLENLVGNAIKFSDPGGAITLVAERSGDDVVFRVADRGRGIAPEEAPHVFDRFWQAAHAKRAGAGLGLAVVKGIVEAHAGHVWVESTLGQGTTFSFTIPAAARPAPRADAQAARGP